MKPSAFRQTIENQFDYICKRAMEDERKDYLKYLKRLIQKEASFSDIGAYVANQFSTNDRHPADLHIFSLNGLSVAVESDLLGEALRNLPDKKREIILLHYFMEMTDSEIAQLLKVNRSTVYRHRTSGLALIKQFMEEHAK
ncbi:sigma-70 family RNA polymerase sigma factor [Sporolactobacillus shoreicorticis]|uniref:RNA polymerase sigma factor n=1 Tax=Sporolactobacillus shoreicorticis TaxID=1923877 RepID=A0ABW5S680_9BACL|nr:sigma-70 family RNA polymerase sigma factor [Sporolactobacillus shoreicorticis]MCO7128194.1 sigma-70 family RNA polymerase sigma factor [Sporolactobacillus shoreicorticis]